MATKNNPGAYDCYANAGPDEEMFVLLARDKHAPVLVRLWAELRRRDGEDGAKVAEAERCSARMAAQCVARGKTPAAMDDVAAVLTGLTNPKAKRGE